MMERFTLENLTGLRKELEAALAQVEQRHGIKLSLGRIGLDPDGLRWGVRLEGKVVGAAGVAEADRRAFAAVASTYGLAAEDFGTPFPFKGETYQIVRWLPRSHAMPLLCQRARDGKLYKFPVLAVEHALRPLGAATAAAR